MNLDIYSIVILRFHYHKNGEKFCLQKYLVKVYMESEKSFSYFLYFQMCFKNYFLFLILLFNYIFFNIIMRK